MKRQRRFSSRRASKKQKIKEQGKEEMKAIQVWQYEDAPDEYKWKSVNGGDEDWIAFIPQEYLDKNGDWIPWATEGSPFGCFCVDEIEVKGGKLLIGSHS